MLTTFKIIGMHCTSCALTVDLDLEELSGIKSSKTNFAKSETLVEFDPAQISVKKIIATIAKSGYQAVLS